MVTTSRFHILLLLFLIASLCAAANAQCEKPKIMVEGKGCQCPKPMILVKGKCIDPPPPKKKPPAYCSINLEVLEENGNRVDDIVVQLTPAQIGNQENDGRTFSNLPCGGDYQVRLLQSKDYVIKEPFQRVRKLKGSPTVRFSVTKIPIPPPHIPCITNEKTNQIEINQPSISATLNPDNATCVGNNSGNYYDSYLIKKALGGLKLVIQLKVDGDQPLNVNVLHESNDQASPSADGVWRVTLPLGWAGPYLLRVATVFRVSQTFSIPYTLEVRSEGLTDDAYERQLQRIISPIKEGLPTLLERSFEQPQPQPPRQKLDEIIKQINEWLIPLSPQQPQGYEMLGLIYFYLLKDSPKGAEYFEKSLDHGGKVKFRIVYRRRNPNSKKFGEPAEGWLTINSSGQVGVDNANGNGSAFSIDKKGFNPPPFVEDKKMILTYQSPPKNQRSKTTKEETTISLFLKTGNAPEMALAEKMISSPTRTQ